MDAIPALRGYVDRKVAELEERMLTRLAELPFRYCDVWLEDFEYQVGNVVTYSGCMWHANRETREKPGTSDAWTLCVKRGRNGKDAKTARTESFDGNE